MEQKSKDAIVPHTRVPAEDGQEHNHQVYETNEDGSTIGIPTSTRAVTDQD